MSILKISLLGPPEVSHFDRRLSFPDRKALALLASFHLEGQLQEAAYATTDHREAVDAFLHKRAVTLC